MSHTLVIVESPAKAKTIEKYLGKEYTVKASVGHVRDLPKSNKDAVDIEAGFVPRYIVSPGKEKVIKDLRSLASKADAVFLATDPDREGEAIAWHVAELIKTANPKMKRVVFHEITKDAILEAVKHPRAVDISLKEAQEARRVLDRLVGYDLSGLIWKKVRYGLSAGRVQSPALRIIMERERQIRAFIPEKFFTLSTNGLTEKKISIPFRASVEPKEETEALRIKKVGEKHSWKITQIKETKLQRAPRPPFTTSTLQQAASSRLGLSPSVTMQAAQRLYEAGQITYMRTDSTNLSDIAKKQMHTFIQKHFGNEYAHMRAYKTKSRSAQEAHEAIRPTDITKENVGANERERSVYRLIWERALSSQMADAVVLRTKISINTISDELIPDFYANGSRVLFPGWLRVDTRARGEDVEVPKLSQGDPISIHIIDIEAKETQPPSRYSEAGLIKELEKRGIGRPSTYASIMKTLADREYVVKEGKTLRPTDTGDLVSTFLETHFDTYISDDFTSQMEDELDQIASGKRTYLKTLSEFYAPFTKAVSSKESIEKITNLGPGPKEFPCPLCGHEMVIKLGRGGKFLSCANFPKCEGARTMEGAVVTEDEPLGIDPVTQEPIFLLTGRFGPYVQLGRTPEKIKGKKQPAPRRASIPSGKELSDITLDDALHYLSLPRELGTHPDTKEPVIANTGRFGPYVGHAGDFRSLKKGDSPYTITLKRALEILKEPKRLRSGESLVKDLGIHPKTKKMISVFESKSGKYLKKGFARIWLPDNVDMNTFTLEDALTLLTKK